MLKRIGDRRSGTHLRRPSPAMLVALISLLVALGGSAYAAINLPANSVGTKQLKNNAVISDKVKDGSLLVKDFKRGQLPLTNPLQRGVTLRGLWGHSWTATAGGQVDFQFYSFGGFRLASAPTPHYIAPGQAAPAGCTGGTFADPRADPGNLCVYDYDRINTTDLSGATSEPEVCSIDTCPRAEDKGFQVALKSAAAGQVVARGSWAVTAP